MSLLLPREVDALLRFPRGRAQRLAKTGELPAVFLPGGEIRFDAEALRAWIESRSRCIPIEVEK